MSAYMNPRWAWNYADEDFMRIMKARCSLGSRVVYGQRIAHKKAIAEKCFTGTGSAHVCLKVVERWLLGIMARMTF